MRSLHWGALFVWLGLVLASQTAGAVMPGEALLPANTPGFVSIENPQQLETQFRASSFSALLDDPRLAPIAGSFRDSATRLRDRWQDRCGLTWHDLALVTSGRLCLAIVTPSGKPAAQVVLADVTGQEPQASGYLASCGQKLVAAGAEHRQMTIDGAAAHLYLIKNKNGTNPASHEIVQAIKDGQLLAAESLAAMEMLLAGWHRPVDEQLAGLPAFRHVMEQSQACVGKRPVIARCWAAPLPLAEALQEPPRVTPNKGSSTLDQLTILKRQGFAAIRGIGGCLVVASEDSDALLGVAFHAPGPFEKAMRLFDFAGEASFAIAARTPASIGAVGALSWNLGEVWQYYGSLFDDLQADGGQGAFNDILDSIRDDPDGPELDLRRDLFPQLTPNVTMISGAPTSADPNGHHSLQVIGTRRDLRPLVQRFMEGDPDVKRVPWQQQVIWQITSPEGLAASSGLLNSVAAVAADEQSLYLASDVELLKQFLAPHSAKDLITNTPAFQEVRRRLDSGSTDHSYYERFAWPEETLMQAHQLLSSAAGDPGPSIAAAILNSILGIDLLRSTGSSTVPKAPVADSTAVREFLAASGARMDKTADGWLMTGFLLRAASRPAPSGN
jgi:hypothetical protein